MIIGITEQELATLFRGLDSDKDGQISSEDFAKAFDGDIEPKAFQLLEAVLRNESEILEHRAKNKRDLLKSNFNFC